MARASLRARILASGRCPCDPTRGQECRYCSGEDADARDTRQTRPAPSSPSDLHE